MRIGATLERGVIAEVTEAGYAVASLDRSGIISPPIKARDNADYAVGDRVYFFLYPDGTGIILCGL